MKRHKPPIAYKFVYLAALMFSVVVLIQSGRIGAERAGELAIHHIILVLLNYFVWTLLIDWVYGLGLSIDSFSKTPMMAIFEIILGSIFLLAFHLITSNVLYYVFMFITSDFTFERTLNTFKSIYVRAFLSRAVDLLVIISLLKAISAYKISQTRKQRVVELESQLHLSKLDTLKAQLNPHFLFNTLHALQTLIGYDDIKAKSMVNKVSGLLRKMLDQRDKHVVTLEEELDYLKDYLEIEQERFHDRLKVNFEIQEETKNVMVPFLMLQPLAENALKHGISMLEDSGIISLTSKLSKDQLLVEMKNTIPSEMVQENLNSTGLGLSNLKKRLLQLYSDGFELKTKKEGGQFKVRITIDIKEQHLSA